MDSHEARRDALRGEALAAIRRKRAVAWAVHWGYVPFVGIMVGVALALDLDAMRVGVGAAAGWIALAMFTRVRAGETRCPRCGNRFHARGVPFLIAWGNPFARACMHCGLPLKPGDSRAT